MVVCLLIGALAALATKAASQPRAEPFVGNFEVLPPGWQQFDGLQYEEDRSLGDSFSLVAEPVRQGSRAARFTVRQGYSPFGHNESTQLDWMGKERPGDEYWYAWSTLFPPDWKRPAGWGIFAEWHANLATSPLIGLSAKGNTADATLLTGLTDEKGNTAAVDRVVPLLPTLSKGRWNDFLVHVRWSQHNDGFVEIFHRIAGEPSMRKLVSFQHVPTFQTTPDGRGVGTYLLFGLYRQSYCPQPTQIGCTSSQGVQSPNTLFHDGFVRAGTYASAAAQAFPGTAPALPPEGSRAVQQEGSELAPQGVRVAASRSRVQTDRGAKVIAEAGRIVARISSASDDRDTAVAEYRVRQRSLLVIRNTLAITAAHLDGRLVVTQIRNAAGRVLAELYVGPRGTLRLWSPRGALRSRGVNLDTGIAAGPEADELRTVELRLARTSLTVGLGGRLITRITSLNGPRSGTRITARVGIDRYDGRAGSGPVQASFGDLAVGAS